MKNSPKNKFNKSIKQNHHKFAHENRVLLDEREREKLA